MCRKTLIEEMQEVTDQKWAKPQWNELQKVTTEMDEKEAHIDFISTKTSELIGKDVIVYCRYLFAVPVRGYITDVSDHDGAYKVSFYNDNPGGPNVTMYTGEFFLPEQCKVQNGEGSKIKNMDALNQQIGGDHSETQVLIRQECNAIRDLLLQKNKEYGDSAINPLRIFSITDQIEQINVRIDDKLSRIKNCETKVIQEDTVQDLIGYLILLRVAKRVKNPLMMYDPDTGDKVDLLI